jgi:signal transduction histidine kinase
VALLLLILKREINLPFRPNSKSAYFFQTGDRACNAKPLEYEALELPAPSSIMSLHPTIFETARVLIVEDDEMSSQLLQRMLEGAGYLKVRVVNDALETLQAFNDFVPDILLLDLYMPEIDGFEIMKQLQQAIPKDTYFPILVLTGDDASDTKVRALNMGAKDFLSKPLDPPEVMARIRNLLETRFLHIASESHSLLLEECVKERTGQLEETLARSHTTQVQVIKSERLGALGVMASGIAHDFNNSLATILGYSDLLLEHPGRTEYLKEILTAGQDARQIVRRLREFYKPDHSDEPLVAVNLNALVEHAVSLTMPRWSNQALVTGTCISVRTELTEIPLIAGNPAELRESLTNLIFNAVDALPGGGTIRIETKVEGEMAVLRITDSGLGMDENTLQRCLEPFFTTKGEAGTGLGLSVVHGIIKRHGGTMEITSDPGMGTSFTLRFPSQASVEDFETPPPVPALERSLRILVVDDQPIICELMAELLRTDGHVVDTASSGGTALVKLRQTQFDLCIADLAMPGMSGDQLADMIKELSPATPVILLTGFGDLLEGTDKYTESIDLVLSKPATLTDLRRAISSVMTSELVTY